MLRMPNCRYIVLSYHNTELSKRGQPLILLMEFETEWGDRERKRYLLSDLVEILNGVRPHTREWLTAVLTEISSARYLTDLTTDELFSRYDSLNVGPLRTE